MHGAASIVEWFTRQRTAVVTADQAVELYFQHHPRTSFLKTTRHGAAICDIGAGDGSLSVFKSWPTPDRNDLELYAYSIEKGPLFDSFRDYRLTDWNVQRPEFGGICFDAVICAHFIEHVAEPRSIVEWLDDNLVEDGCAYIEWPSPNALNLPSRSVLEASDVNLIISRYDDDGTHRNALPNRQELCDAFVSAGFTIERQGIIRIPWVEEQLMATSRDSEDPFPRQAAFWLFTGWAQFIQVRRGPATPLEQETEG